MYFGSKTLSLIMGGIARANEAIYERGEVKRGGADFVSRAPAHPPRRRLRSIWPISDLSAVEVVVHTRHTSPEPEAEGEFLPMAGSVRGDADVT